MEKLEKKHHDHKFTEWLKNIIFGLVMLAPMLAIAVRCGYVMWNKNAKDNYSGNNELISQYENIDALDTSLLNKKLYFNVKTRSSVTINSGENYLYFDEYEIIQTGYNLTQSIKGISFYVDSSLNINAWLLYEDNTRQAINNSGSFAMTFRYLSTNMSVTQRNAVVNSHIIQEVVFNDIYNLDNAFSYSVSQLSNDSNFNWTRNTGIYQPINAMVSGLEIENDTLQILLAYWSLMTAVYIVFDLIIFCFTKLTHFING